MIEKRNDGVVLAIRVISLVCCLLGVLLSTLFDFKPLDVTTFIFSMVLTIRMVSVAFYSISDFDNKIICFLLGPTLDVLYLLLLVSFSRAFWSALVISVIFVIPFLPFLDKTYFNKNNKFYQYIFSLFKNDYKKTRGLSRKTQKYLLTHNFSYSSRLFELLDKGAELTSEQVVILNNLVDIAKQREVEVENEQKIIDKTDEVINSIYEKVSLEFFNEKKEERDLKLATNEGLVNEINALKEMV